MLREPAVYLQGDAVPRCFGFFQGEFHLDTISCLLLEDCGPDMVTDFHEADTSIKLKLVDKLYKIHEAGLAHQDVSPDNVVIKDDEPFWIDFEYALRHVCPTRVEVKPGDFMPEKDQLRCGELRDFIGSLGICKSTYVHFRGCTMLLEAVHSPHYLYNNVPSAHLATAEKRAQVWREAKETFRKVEEDHKLFLAYLSRKKAAQKAAQ
ncbi:hypothetical protein JAAARDRAFT_486715 [Jaapia argillacea MUCL 33604]|uniref:Protein kinase domain-containing protein n=1 Tax=Jaapia argillacea MUCL 33604 TaxID=933084 RepID=A0A067PEI2_9AGAM|nr:hypothetical protein JAAARDRAFT_486715 [Jaapia argillacea MUCL 33604]